MTEMAQVVTGRSDGQANDLSAAEEGNIVTNASFPSFMLDSPTQVAINLHYIAEFEEKSG